MSTECTTPQAGVAGVVSALSLVARNPRSCEGISNMTHDTNLYKGNIVAIDGSGEAGTMFRNGREI